MRHLLARIPLPIELTRTEREVLRQMLALACDDTVRHYLDHVRNRTTWPSVDVWLQQCQRDSKLERNFHDEQP